MMFADLEYSLHLSHNEISHMPFRFQQCSILKYLNLRDNRFEDFPKAVRETSPGRHSCANGILGIQDAPT